MDRIIGEILEECTRQNLKYGKIPAHRAPSVYLAILGEEYGEVCRATLDGDSEGYSRELIELAASAIRALADLREGSSTLSLEQVCPKLDVD